MKQLKKSLALLALFLIGSFAFIENAFSVTPSIIDTVTLDGSAQPSIMTVTPDGEKIYTVVDTDIAESNGSVINVIRTADQSVTSIPIALQVTRLSMDPLGQKVFVTIHENFRQPNPYQTSFLVIDVATDTIEPVPISAAPNGPRRGMIITDRYLWVPSIGNDLLIFNREAPYNLIRRIPLLRPASHYSLVLTPNGTKILAMASIDNNTAVTEGIVEPSVMEVIDVSTVTHRQRLFFGNGDHIRAASSKIRFSPDGQRLYHAATGSFDVTIFSVAGPDATIFGYVPYTSVFISAPKIEVAPTASGGGTEQLILLRHASGGNLPSINWYDVTIEGPFNYQLINSVPGSGYSSIGINTLLDPTGRLLVVPSSHLTGYFLPPDEQVVHLVDTTQDAGLLDFLNPVIPSIVTFTDQEIPGLPWTGIFADCPGLSSRDCYYLQSHITDFQLNLFEGYLTIIDLGLSIINDQDDDGIDDTIDLCPDTSSELVPTLGLRSGYYIDSDGDGTFETNRSRFRPAMVVTPEYRLEDTAGCNCLQIADRLHWSRNAQPHGCSRALLDRWISLVDLGIAF